MPDDTSGSAAAQAQSVADQLLNELQAAVSASPASAGGQATATATDIQRMGAQTIAQIKQAAEDAYWTPRRQMEQAITDRTTALSRAAAAEQRIAELKQQIGT